MTDRPTYKELETLARKHGKIYHHDEWVRKHGLPIVNVTYERQSDRILVRVHYNGIVMGDIDGDFQWSNNGTFTVEQRLTFTVDSPMRTGD
jgi:hypothetical protein